MKDFQCYLSGLEESHDKGVEELKGEVEDVKKDLAKALEIISDLEDRLGEATQHINNQEDEIAMLEEELIELRNK